MEIKRELYLSNYRIDHNKSKSAEYALFKKILNDFYASYNIINPDTIIHIPPLDADVKEVLFKYICPNCLSALISEWIYIEHICMPTKHVKDQYKEEAYRIEHEIDEAFKDYEKKKTNEMHQFFHLKNCPICNAKLKKTFPFLLTSCDFHITENDIPFHVSSNLLNSLDWFESYKNSVPDMFEDCYRDKCTWDLVDEGLDKIFIDPILDLHENFIQLCDMPLPMKRLKAEKNTDFLKEYLSNLINLETNILCMSKRLKELYLLREESNRDIAYEQGISNLNLTKEIDQTNFTLLNLKQELSGLESEPVTYDTIKYPPEPEKPKIRKATFFNRSKIEALNAQAEAEYQEAIKKYLAAVEECNKRTEKNKAEAENQKKVKIEKYSERINKSARDLAMAQHELNQRRANASDYPTPAAGKKYILDTEIATVEEAIKNSFQCRNELYSYNIIFEKYRNIVAVSSFYEYLMAGRCDSLEGVNGAYNIYENESRMDAIITKLDEIETKLDEIKANQFMIYNKLNSIESSLNSLNRTMEKAVASLDSINTNTANMSKYLENISKNTDVIAHNTAVSAYYSKVNAELTNALGFMVALN